jgi:glycosyltransferase involved in cell wall biosynthesis
MTHVGLFSALSMNYRIAIDGYRLVGPPTSVGTYTVELLDLLRAEGCAITLLVPHEQAGSYLEDVLKRCPDLRVIKPVAPEKPYGQWSKLVQWNQSTVRSLLREADVDALISTYHQVPVKVPPNVARLSIIHDCCGLRQDCGYRKHGRSWWRHWTNLKAAALFADAVIPISQATRDDFISRYPGSSERVVDPIYNQVTRPVLDREEVLGDIEKFGISSNRYILGFSLVGLRKGTDIAMRAYSEYRRQAGSFPLVLMGGGNDDLVKWGLDSEYQDTVIRTDRISDDLRDALYAHAACFLFMSRCEGFGYPIVEASRQGCPTVLWKNGTAIELLGSSLPMMEALEPLQGAALIKDFAELEDSARDALRENLITRSLQFANPQTGKAFIAAIRDAVARCRGEAISLPAHRQS